MRTVVSDSVAEVRQVVALVPAHNEAEVITDAIQGLQVQEHAPERIIVVADNCTDDTVRISREAGAEVFETVGNTDKKAGALNQALAVLLPQLGDDAAVLIQDADSALDQGFVLAAVRYLNSDPKLGAVGGTFRGRDDHTFVGHLQRNEYARYARDVRRLKGKCLVVTGTAAVLRVPTLREVSRARLDGRIPRGDGRGGIYDTTVLTEDNELTFALKHLGYSVLSPKECTLTTEVMPTWRALWNQRLRWKRGALENCVQYGVTRVTWRYWGRQMFTALGIIVTAIFLGSIAWSLYAYGGLYIRPFWLAITAVFVVERIVTVKDRGPWRMLLAASMYEIFYDIFLQVVHAKAYTDVVLRRERRW
ncbi:glycosyltransferase family 2 protein [Nocardioides sp. zg-536]|uniref:Glycosyltransferase family 2 protein n=1 Tax=Nocardioides faecalis TaxID=2803858 RepID=A0A938XYC3_9ACTN|nr:glycosyltransferase family 2 protein [Nocardioides faecalis]MBM9458431.1 glycosyltransferase family 2 protein [Nocardioides faecalis]MBS4753261.1 glycosyltransferase family 2 protein [Nocardioides faecalis]QVI58446.1 glycosyltransferase family 2 protein [Nocardioides faecalis]